MLKEAPIGVFDSGIGGLTVVKALKNEMPDESIVYLADSANAPYGSLSGDKIIELSSRNTSFLIDKGVKMIVVACNTATGAAIEHLRKKFSLPFVGMEPAVKPAAANSKSKKIAVLATARTFEADHFNNTVSQFAEGVEVFFRIGYGLVELIEKGELESYEMQKLLASYLEPMVDGGIDQLVLGCTHYPLLIPVIRRIIPPNIVIHDPAPAVARQARRILEDKHLLIEHSEKLKDEFHSTGDIEILQRFVSMMNSKEF